MERGIVEPDVVVAKRRQHPQATKKRLILVILPPDRERPVNRPIIAEYSKPLIQKGPKHVSRRAINVLPVEISAREFASAADSCMIPESADAVLFRPPHKSLKPNLEKGGVPK